MYQCDVRDTVNCRLLVLAKGHKDALTQLERIAIDNCRLSPAVESSSRYLSVLVAIIRLCGVVLINTSHQFEGDHFH